VMNVIGILIGLYWTCRLLFNITIFIILILPIHEHQRSFHPLLSSSISFFNGL
jgi:hypothetical protein